MPTEKMPPQNELAEEAILGSCFIDADALPRIASIIQPGDFANDKRRWTFEAMLELQKRGAPVDFLTVCDQMEAAGMLDAAGGSSFVTLLVNAVPTSLHAVHYAEMVERLATRRRLIDAAAVITREAWDEGRDLDEVQDGAVKGMMDAGSRQRSEPRPMSELVSAYYDRIEFLAKSGKPPGLPIGYADLDTVLEGLHDSDMVILAGRPSAGKSALAICMAHNVAKRFGKNVAFFSLEMSGEQVTQRLISLDSAIHGSSLKRGDLMDSEWAAFNKTTVALGNLGIYVDDTPGLSPMELRSKASALHAAIGLDLVIVDYLQMMRPLKRGRDLRHEVTEISHDIKALARHLNLPVLALSQLSRSCENRADKRPLLSDLRESGALEQDADVVIFVYRDEMYDPNTETPNVAEVNVAKHRNGMTGTVKLYFEKHLTRFLDLEVRKTELNGAYGEVL